MVCLIVPYFYKKLITKRAVTVPAQSQPSHKPYFISPCDFFEKWTRMSCISLMQPCKMRRIPSRPSGAASCPSRWLYFPMSHDCYTTTLPRHRYPGVSGYTNAEISESSLYMTAKFLKIRHRKASKSQKLNYQISRYKSHGLSHDTIVCLAAKTGEEYSHSILLPFPCGRCPPAADGGGRLIR